MTSLSKHEVSQELYQLIEVYLHAMNISDNSQDITWKVKEYAFSRLKEILDVK